MNIIHKNLSMKENEVVLVLNLDGHVRRDLTLLTDVSGRIGQMMRFSWYNHKQVIDLCALQMKKSVISQTERDSNARVSIGLSSSFCTKLGDNIIFAIFILCHTCTNFTLIIGITDIPVAVKSSSCNVDGLTLSSELVYSFLSIKLVEHFAEQLAFRCGRLV